MRSVGVIPARGGSKGIPRKNLVPLGGEPLVVHTLRAAAAARLLDAVVVSTDDTDIAAVARTHGVEVVERPAALARDDSPTEDALIHAVETLGVEPEYVVTLEPTSPLRTGRLIDRCLELAYRERADAVVTVAETSPMVGRLRGDRFEFLLPGLPRRRQDRDALYRESSTVWVTRTAHLLARRSVLADPLHAVIVPDDEAIDVNTPLDLVVAEALLRRREETT